MFAEPQVFTISGSAKSLNKLTSNDVGSRYATADRKHRLSISHYYGKRERHVHRLDIDETTANPLISGNNVISSVSYTLTVDVPRGFDTTLAKAQLDAMLANLSASTGANLTKLVGGES